MQIPSGHFEETGKYPNFIYNTPENSLSNERNMQKNAYKRILV